MSKVALQHPFITDDFLLQNDFARTLYHDYVKNLPIIDYHNHLPPQDVASNRQFDNLTKIWLEGDHYKWRAMRTLGVDERFITGNATDFEKFEKWATTVPYTLRNPLYHWSHLELKRYFGVDKLLTPATAKEIFDDCSLKLNDGNFSARRLLQRMNVEVICTTDDPTDSLEHHRKISKDGFEVKCLPAFRPDKSLGIHDIATYRTYIQKLSVATGVEIKDYNSLLSALANRIDFFEKHGCKLSDHGLEQLPTRNPVANPEAIFRMAWSGGQLSVDEINGFRYALLIELSKLYHTKGWTQQFHLGALRNTNARMLNALGPDTGFDSIGDFSQAKTLAYFLNDLDRSNQLAQTVLYNLNPADNEVLATMVGNFNDGSVKGKMQFGSAWWFLDQKDGMTKQIDALSNLGLLSCFIGMLTDSRSFMSFPRHEYFRRILCNIFGQDVKNGELPADEKWLGKIVQDICYNNAKSYFKF